jgi:hypothetical protein
MKKEKNYRRFKLNHTGFYAKLVFFIVLMNMGSYYSQKTRTREPKTNVSNEKKNNDSTNFEKETARSLEDIKNTLKSFEEILKNISTNNSEQPDSTIKALNKTIDEQNTRITEMTSSIEEKETQISSLKDASSKEKGETEKLRLDLLYFCKSVMMNTDQGTISLNLPELTTDIALFNSQSLLIQEGLKFLDEGVLPKAYNNKYPELKNKLLSISFDATRFKKQSEMQELLKKRFAKFDALAEEFKDVMNEMAGITDSTAREKFLQDLSLKIAVEQYPYLSNEYKLAKTAKYKCPW